MLGMRKEPDGNRSAFDIIAGILAELREPTGKTNIMTHCNMSFSQSGKYLDIMASNDLIQSDATAGKVRYHRTEAGREFLKIYNKMILLLT